MWFHHMQLAMPRGGEPDARRFYRDLLGLEEMPKPPELAARGGCWFHRDDVELHLRVEEPFSAARKAHPAMAVTDLDDVQRRLQEDGHEVVVDELLPGSRRIYTSDPFGNRIELIQARPGTEPLS